MESVWASCSQTGVTNQRPQPEKRNTTVGATRPASSSLTPHTFSIWSQPILTPANLGSNRTQDASSSATAPQVQLYHPRYQPNDPLISKRLVQERIKPLLVSTQYGSAGLPDQPFYDAVLWPDTSRTRGGEQRKNPSSIPTTTTTTTTAAASQPNDQPLNASTRPRRRGRLADAQENNHRRPPPQLFQLVQDGPEMANEPNRLSSYSGSVGQADAAFHPPENAYTNKLSGLSLANLSTHVTPILPFNSLVVNEPTHVSELGFRPLKIDSIEHRWNERLGLAKPIESNQANHLSQEHESTRPTSDESNTATNSHRYHDIATSPIHQRSSGTGTLSSEAHATYSLALSPQQTIQPNSQAHSYAFPSAPPGVNPDTHLANQAEHLTQWSIRALKQQLEDLKKEEHQIIKEEKRAIKQIKQEERKWNEMVGLSPVKERNETDTSLDGLDSSIQAALTMDLEKDSGTQTDVTLGLHHALKPRMAGRNKSEQSKSVTAKINAEVAKEFEEKEQQTFGVRPKPTQRQLAVAHLPTFQSHADQYRQQLRQQYQVLFDAKLAGQQTGDSHVGELVEARLKRMQEETLYHLHPSWATKRRDGNSKNKEKVEEEEKEEMLNPIPPTVIGSRTATLLFVDPNMMQRKLVQLQSKESIPIDPATADIPNKVVEMTQQNERALKEKLGFDIPQPTFIHPGTTHRLLNFEPTSNSDVKKQPVIPQPPPINVVQPPPDLSDYPSNSQPTDPYNSYPVGTNQWRDEFSDLDADMLKLEHTIRAIHEEFAHDIQTQTVTAPHPTQSQASLIPSWNEMSAREFLEGHDRTSEANLLDASQYLSDINRVLGVPEQTRQQISRAVSSSARQAIQREKQSNLNQKQALSQSTKRPTTINTNTQPSQLPVLTSNDFAPKASSSKPQSKLAAALESYLALDLELQALTPSMTLQSPISLPSKANQFNRDELLTRSHDQNEFHRETPIEPKSNYRRPATPARPQPTSVHTSWNSVDDESTNEQQQVEAMLQEEQQHQYQRRSSNSEPSSLHRLSTPPSLQSSTSFTSFDGQSSSAALSRVTEGEHESSRSTLGTSPPATKLRQRPVQPFDQSDEMDDASGLDRSMVIQLDQQPPYPYEQSLSSGMGDSFQSGVSQTSLVSPKRSMVGPRSPITTNRMGSISPIHSTNRPGHRQQDSIERPTSAMHQTNSDRSHLSHEATRMPTPATTTTAIHVTVPSAGTIGSQAPHKTSSLSAMAIERERRRQRARASHGMIQSNIDHPNRQSTNKDMTQPLRQSSTHTDHTNTNTTHTKYSTADDALKTSSDRQVAAAHDLINHFRQLLEDLPTNTHEEVSTSNHPIDEPTNQPFESYGQIHSQLTSETMAPPTHLSSTDDFSSAMRSPTSWEDDLPEFQQTMTTQLTDEISHRYQQPERTILDDEDDERPAHHHQHNPLDDLPD